MSKNIGYIGELTNIDLNTLVKPIHTGLYGCNDSSIITSYNHYPDDTSINQCMVSMQPQSDTEEPNHVICMISPMYFSEVERWKETSV